MSSLKGAPGRKSPSVRSDQTSDERSGRRAREEEAKPRRGESEAHWPIGPDEGSKGGMGWAARAGRHGQGIDILYIYNTFIYGTRGRGRRGEERGKGRLPLEMDGKKSAPGASAKEEGEETTRCQISQRMRLWAPL